MGSELTSDEEDLLRYLSEAKLSSPETVSNELGGSILLVLFWFCSAVGAAVALLCFVMIQFGEDARRALNGKDEAPACAPLCEGGDNCGIIHVHQREKND
mmetsp:Transcript_458/g.1589  ORF Transcript_458/g.1589 Transcript_458/m.1589 type:complete len:100 (-) Transcript_458:223-522(-)|eukprot:CAMPEP_0198728302 /NCGR_PEP_ID=MMETSP1475-20131203/8280_1 /TAXON_ID= ORGANISM="Unidentified sp., Strain CCMP1999" /NCGR_SAMPLE_ID=MMETSP1475 /ASSEMBLY_ACC=CAM_ASM_001111 /LENGTH=99 /DNA_ID=CAMNT_0044490621 /DNA_START=102 /DNA_END=401 /DNA_ORIENTATION=-